MIVDTETASLGSTLIGARAAGAGEIQCDGTKYTVTPPRVILDLAQLCNLRCGFCPVWGRDPNAQEGVMEREAADALLYQLPPGTVISPSWYGEPLMIPELQDVLRLMKDLGHVVNMNTNGLTLTPALAEFFVHIKLDSIMFSIDAVTADTLKKVRGIRALERIENAVIMMQVARGDAELPRIGVSFTVQEENEHERRLFEDRWIGAVDVVRIGLEYKGGAFQGMKAPAERVPCPLLYETMVVRHDGAVPICCLDSTCSAPMGNAITDGVAHVWRAMDAVRAEHEAGRFTGICAKCNGWADKVYHEEETESLLIRRGAQYTWFNRKDRMGSWRRA